MLNENYYANILEVAINAAKETGKILRENFGKNQKVNEYKTYDVKLELDDQCQKLIESIILKSYPHHSILGEEGTVGNQEGDNIWVVDPIDGTVNYFYGIPHFCVSIAFTEKNVLKAGIIYDPMQDEMWTIKDGDKFASLNGEPIKPSNRKKIEDAIVTVGCSKSSEALDIGIARFKEISVRARKVRMMGSAALGMAYIACGRLDAYIEDSINWWDIAAGKMLLEAGGGIANLKIKEGKDNYFSIIATNGCLDLSDIKTVS